MKNLKYHLGFSFEVRQNTLIRDGLIIEGTKAFIEEINESEYDGDGINTPYRVFFYDCVVGDAGELLKDDEGVKIGATDWFSENEIEEIITSE